MPNPASTVPKDKHPQAEQLYTEVCWVADRLMEARDAIADAPLVVKYLDTNGNERTKTNPAYEAYNALFSTFIKGCRALDDMLADAGPTGEGAKLTLDNLKMMVNKPAAKVAK